MAQAKKTLVRVLSGRSDAGIAFRQLRALLKALGFDERIRGDHYIYSCEGIEEILNLQPKAAKAKPYQVKQVRQLILKYGLGSLL